MQYNKETSYYKDISPEEWHSWQWQMRHRLKTTKQLQQVLALPDSEIATINSCLAKFRMAITPYYASLINTNDAHCPIRRQAIPSAGELIVQPYELRDPLAEDEMSPVKNLVHRYPDRVLFLVTHQCAMYCRHCTRRRLTGEQDLPITDSALENALRYIRQHQEVRDVLISGGDPLVLSNKRLEEIISRIRSISHVEIIRIGTRAPVVLPMRITDTLTQMLKKYQPLWINTHFNHPRELTPEAQSACEKLIDAGIPVGNQSVLLKGINDNVAVMKRLLLKLVQTRIRPYYLYQCDIAEGISHFRTPVETGLNIIDGLIGNITGFAIPRFVIDAPSGGGKIPLLPNYIVKKSDDNITLQNYQGQLYTYPHID